MSYNRWIKKRMFLVYLLVIALSFTVISSSPIKPFPEVIPLPNGFRPEGIATGNGSTFFVGSIPTGAIYRGDYSTGAGEILVPSQSGHAAIGLKFDSRSGLLFVAGGPTGSAFIYDGNTGTNVAAIQLTASSTTFVNDVVVTRWAAYFTDSFQPVLYRIPLNNDGSLPNPVISEEIPLGGEFEFDEAPGAFNTNGIDATPNGKTLIIVNSSLGTLYTVDPSTGNATSIDLGGESVPAGDGILLHGKTLYVVQNAMNQIAVVKLDPQFSSGLTGQPIKSIEFDVPTTIARFGSSLYAVNARFSTTPMPDTEYDVIRVTRH